MSSTYCFCFFSRNSADLHKCYFNKIWDSTFLYKNGTFSCTQLGKSILFYIPQMCTFAFSIVRNALLLVGNFFALLFSFSGHPKSASPTSRGLILLENVVAILIDVVGIICPPAGYDLHTIAEEHFKMLQQKYR